MGGTAVFYSLIERRRQNVRKILALFWFFFWRRDGAEPSLFVRRKWEQYMGLLRGAETVGRAMIRFEEGGQVVILAVIRL